MLDPGTLASTVRNHRKAARLSQLQLAELAGVGKTVIFDIEKGKESVQIDTLRKILNVLNIQVQLVSPLMDNLQISVNEES